mmetsp:Transcript_749/g.1586  ORF Transcript_749/g.1586 Transcript_749/m.1586 type:complete len:306 (-) Transcript_749:3867-4784(-)
MLQVIIARGGLRRVTPDNLLNLNQLVHIADAGRVSGVDVFVPVVVSEKHIVLISVGEAELLNHDSSRAVVGRMSCSPVNSGKSLLYHSRAGPEGDLRRQVVRVDATVKLSAVEAQDEVSGGIIARVRRSVLHDELLNDTRDAFPLLLDRDVCVGACGEIRCRRNCGHIASFLEGGEGDIPAARIATAAMVIYAVSGHEQVTYFIGVSCIGQSKQLVSDIITACIMLQGVRLLSIEREGESARERKRSQALERARHSRTIRVQVRLRTAMVNYPQGIPGKSLPLRQSDSPLKTAILERAQPVNCKP